MDKSVRVHIYTSPQDRFNFYRKLKSLIKIYFLNQYPGHSGVTRSLILGLQDLGINYSLNSYFGRISEKDYIVCLSGLDTLSSLVLWKKTFNKSNILFAGPNIVVRSNEQSNLLGNPEINKVLVPSPWIKRAYVEDLPSLSKNLLVWASGIDTDFWKPTRYTDIKKILLYLKNDLFDFSAGLNQLLESIGYDVTTIRYGAYTPESFKDDLQTAYCCIYISNCESQGLALAEMWSMGCKTLVYQPQSLHINGKDYGEFSSAPYLTQETGSFWNTIEELKVCLNEFDFTPELTRESAVSRFSNVISARNLLDLLGLESI